jgi:hypothetical protein
MRKRGVPLLAAVALCAACTPTQLSAPTLTAPTPLEPSQAASSVPGEIQLPDQTDLPTGEATTQTAPPPPPTTQAPDTAPPPGQQLQLGPGQTAHLTYFDVTFQRFAHGQDGISAGWRVEACYRRPHPEQNADNTTRVSADPWSVQVLDAEGPGGRPTWLGINEFPRDNQWSPPYPTTNLKLGACQVGWLGVRHGNPDLQFLALRYAPADFGDVVTWSTSG